MVVKMTLPASMIPWTEDEIETLIQMYDAGYNYYEISKKLDRTYVSVQSKCEEIFTGSDRIEKHNDLNKPRNIERQKRWNHRWIPEEDKKLLELRSKGYTIKEIASITGFTEWSIGKRFGRIKPPEATNPLKFEESKCIEHSVSRIPIKKRVKEVSKLYFEEGKSLTDISNCLGLDVKTVEGYLYKTGKYKRKVEDTRMGKARGDNAVIRSKVVPEHKSIFQKVVAWIRQ